MHRPKPDWTTEGVVKEKGHCGIVALARVTGVPVFHVEEAIRKQFNKRGNWKGSTFCEERKWFLEEHGIVYNVLSPAKTVMKRVMPGEPRQKITVYGAPTEIGLPDDIIPASSLQRFVSGTKLGVTYIVHTGKHVVTVRDGWVGDQVEIESAWLHWARKKRVKYALEIH